MQHKIRVAHSPQAIQVKITKCHIAGQKLTLRAAVEHVGAADAVQEGTAAVQLVRLHGHAAGAVAAAGAVRADLAPLGGHRPGHSR